MNASAENDEVRAAFRDHVPEVASGVVELVSIARERGRRVMVSVRSQNESVDPVWVCSKAVKRIGAELKPGGLTIIRWSDSISEFIANTMRGIPQGPSRSPKVTLNRETHQAEVRLEPEALQRMIENDGLLLRLACRLVGWEIKLVAFD